MPGPNNPPNEAGKWEPKAIPDVQCGKYCPDEPKKYIDTTQIAKMLGRTNWKRKVWCDECELNIA